jgi:hypothetical protein
MKNDPLSGVVFFVADKLDERYERFHKADRSEYLHVLSEKRREWNTRLIQKRCRFRTSPEPASFLIHSAEKQGINDKEKSNHKQSGTSDVVPDSLFETRLLTPAVRIKTDIIRIMNIICYELILVPDT